MKILKPGKVEQRKFVCPGCGCEFLAMLNEADPCGWVCCPEEKCSSGCSWECGEPYEEPTQDDLERLTVLVHDAPQKHANSWPEAAEIIAKYLIVNGVTFREVSNHGT